MNYFLYAAELRILQELAKLPQQGRKAAAKAQKVQENLQLLLSEEGMKDCRPVDAGDVDFTWKSFKQQYPVCVLELVVCCLPGSLQPKLLLMAVSEELHCARTLEPACGAREMSEHHRHFEPWKLLRQQGCGSRPEHPSDLTKLHPWVQEAALRVCLGVCLGVCVCVCMYVAACLS